MKKQNEVITKYKSIFGQEKEYLDILQECHSKMISFKDKSFTLMDFKADVDYRDNLLMIDSFRKYSAMDDFLLGVDDYSLIPLENINHLSQKITYHDIMEAIDLFDETFNKMESFYIEKNLTELVPQLATKNVLTVNDLFKNDNHTQFTLYYIESSRKYCFGSIYDGYEYIHYLPFKKINLESDEPENNLVYGYLYLIQEFLSNHHQEMIKDKTYTTLYKEYGVTYEEYLKKPTSSSKYVVYHNNLRDFLIEPTGLTYYPRMNQIRFDVVDLMVDKQPQYEDFYRYFKGLQFDQKKAEDYVRKNWFLNNDVGRVYGLKYNIVGTADELESYKEKIIQRKLSDIELNFHMYKKHGLVKYNQEDDSVDLKNHYTKYIREFLEHLKTEKSEFNSENDTRIDLDSNSIFRIGSSDSLSHEYFINSFKYANIVSNDYNVFGDYKKSVSIQVHLEEFIHAYNQHKGSEILPMNYEWYFPYKQLHDYVENSVQAFCHVQLTSGVREEEFRVLRDIFFYEGSDRKKILDHPEFIQDTGKYFIQSRNPYYFEVPVILNLFMDLKEFNQIQKGKHPIFKSKYSENLLQKEALKIASSERFLGKKEITAQEDYDVVYTGLTSEYSNLHKGTKGKIVNVDKDITILDELGNTHKETFRSVQKSGWKHLSTVNQENLINTLSLSEKAFLEKARLGLPEPK